MPTVDVDPDELCQLAGVSDVDVSQLKTELFSLGLEFEGNTDDDRLRFEFEPDRLDRLSVEGIARSWRYQRGNARGVYIPPTNEPDWSIHVDEAVPAARPYVTGAIVRDVELDESTLESLIQLQEKLHATMGRDRRKGAIGIHDLTMLKGSPGTDPADQQSIRYTGISPEGDSFVPLESDSEMTPAAVLDSHSIGEQYAELVSEYDRLPAIYDDIGLFSFPPVINGRRTEVTTRSRDLLIELTGTDQWTIDSMLNILCYTLDARGGRIESITVDYPDGDHPLATSSLTRPDFSVDTKSVRHDRIERILGIELESDTVIDLAERAGLDAEIDSSVTSERQYSISIPPYRVDVRHPVDIIDDIGRAYGFNELEPRYPDVSTVGGRHDRSRHERSTREVLIGLGFEDLLNFHLTSHEANFDRLGIDPADAVLGGGEPVRIKEPYSAEYEIVRTWALPSLLMVLENNTHRSYPQDIAEIGLAAQIDHSESTHVAERRTVAALLARSEVGFEDAKARLAAVARRFAVDLETPATDHPTFIDGRAASIHLAGVEAGVIGELHPEVLVTHGLEVPVAGFEFRLDALEEE